MSSPGTTISSETLNAPLLARNSQTFRGRMQRKWHNMDRPTRATMALIMVLLVAALASRIVIEILSSPNTLPDELITIPPQDDNKNVHDDEERRNAVRAAMQHAWSGYQQYAFGHDELKPVSNSSNDKWGGWAVSLVDALDSLYIMELYDEFNQGITHVAKMNFTKVEQSDYQTPFFEMVIRVLAGLLSSYEMSLDRRVLSKAKEVGDVLFTAFDSKSGIPYPKVDVTERKAIKSAHRICIAEAGTVQLEYWKLSELTGDPKYHRAAQRVVDLMDRAKKPYPGLYPIWININSANIRTGQITFGGMGDSWYEYMIKQYLYSRKTHDQYKRMYEESIDGLKEKMTSRSIFNNDMVYVGDLDSSAKKFSPRFQHLTCFVPGMLALGSKALGRKDDLELAKQLMYTCYQMYNATDTGLGPEYVLFRNSADMGISSLKNNSNFKIESLPPPTEMEKEVGFYFGLDRGYILRPETVESLMVLYRVTGDPKYKDWGWDIFKAIERWTKTPTAYSAYKDVMSTEGDSQWNDSMESFFLAETLKYLYLLFSPADYYSLDDYVFNTEAHPFRILKGEIH